MDAELKGLDGHASDMPASSIVASLMTRLNEATEYVRLLGIYAEAGK